MLGGLSIQSSLQPVLGWFIPFHDFMGTSETNAKIFISFSRKPDFSLTVHMFTTWAAHSHCKHVVIAKLQPTQQVFYDSSQILSPLYSSPLLVSHLRQSLVQVFILVCLFWSHLLLSSPLTTLLKWQIPLLGLGTYPACYCLRDFVLAFLSAWNFSQISAWLVPRLLLGLCSNDTVSTAFS